MSMRTTVRRLRRSVSTLTLLCAISLIGASSASAVAANKPAGVGVPAHANVATTTVCHVPPGSNVPSSKLTIPNSALGGHLGHGDVVIAAGGVCAAAPQPVVDACPNNTLNPGVQVAGTVCKVATTPTPTDACPNALNPGVQAAGTICIVAGTPNGTGTTGTTPTAGGPGAAAAAGGTAGTGGAGVVAVETDDQHTMEVAEAAAEPTAGVNANTTPGLASATVAGVTARPTGTLPFTGLETWLLVAIGGSFLMFGGMAYRSASKRAHRSR